MSITLSTRHCIRLLSLAWLLLCLAALAMELLGFLRDETDVWGLFPIFSLHDDQHLPGWYLAGLWLGLGLLCWVRGRTEGTPGALGRLGWSALAGLCVLLSLDEATGFIESLPDPLGSLFGAVHSPAAFALELLLLALLVIVAVFAGLVLAVCLPLFLRAWPRRLLYALAAAGLLFVAAHALAGSHLPFRLWHLVEGVESGGSLVVNLRAHASFFLRLAGASLLFGSLYAELQASLGELRLVVLSAACGRQAAGEPDLRTEEARAT